MGEAATYDKLPEAEQQALPNVAHLVAALEWAEPGPEAEETNYWHHRGGR